VLSLLERGERLPVTTSAGRLFDAVAALLGVRARITYEGQAAIELEAFATQWSGPIATYPVDVGEDAGVAVLDPRPLVLALTEDLARGAPPAAVAAAFHQGLAEATAAVAAKVAGDRGLDTVALSGGVFQNVLLTQAVERPLRRAGLNVLLHHQVPPNDGGISIGQAAIAALAPAPS
jgi:hydrogenase maturation protein HypF